MLRLPLFWNYTFSLDLAPVIGSTQRFRITSPFVQDASALDDIVLCRNDQPYSLGRSLCFVCADASSAFGRPTLLTDDTGEEALYPSRLDPGDFRTDEIDPATDPAGLHDATSRDALRAPQAALGDTIYGERFSVPASSTALLLAAGLLRVSARARRVRPAR